MILIVSSEDDKTTMSVQQWLIHYGAKYTRINDSTRIGIRRFQLNDNSHEIELVLNDTFHRDVILNLNNVTAVWYRRGHINIYTKAYENQEFNARANARTNEYLFHEKKILHRAIVDLLKDKQSINSEFDTEINKLIALKAARKNGLHIPSTLISGDIGILDDFIENEHGVITKAINESGYRTAEFEVSGGTEVISHTNFVREREKGVFPSQLQENLDKAYELRIFFLFKSYYATAIFSQANKKTRTDFRNYDFKKPNRVVAYQLPEIIREKLIHTMQDLDINCGSIDMVVTKEGRYVFLEVNPVGQFEQVSYPCNYYLEKKIAQTLIDISNGKKSN